MVRIFIVINQHSSASIGAIFKIIDYWSKIFIRQQWRTTSAHSSSKAFQVVGQALRKVLDMLDWSLPLVPRATEAEKRRMDRINHQWAAAESKETHSQVRKSNTNTCCQNSAPAMAHENA